MSKQEVLRKVPADRVDEVVASFRKDGATQVDKNKNSDGTFDVTATFPNGN